MAEDAWPPPAERRSRRLHLDWGYLSEAPAAAHEIVVSSPQTLGVRGGEWCGFGADGEAPRDQRADDGGSMVFDSEAFGASIDLLGAPLLELEVASNRPVAFLVARLCDVAPDGASARISYAILNLCHREGHVDPRPLEPGRFYRVRLQFDDVGHHVRAGHRLRLALSTAYWPMIWPSPEPVTLTVRTSNAWLDLPERPPAPGDSALPPFARPTTAAGTRSRKISSVETERKIEIDLTTNEMVYTLEGDGGEFGGASLTRLDEIDLELGYHQLRRYRILEDDPLSAQTEFEQSAVFRRRDWHIRIECRTRLMVEERAFVFSGSLEAFENGEAIARRTWDLRLQRQLL